MAGISFELLSLHIPSFDSHKNTPVQETYLQTWQVELTVQAAEAAEQIKERKVRMSL